MKLKLICIGKVKEKPLQTLMADYADRISHDAKLEIIEIKDSDISSEGKKIIETIEKIRDSKHVFALSEEGSEFSSVDLSRKIKKLDSENKLIVFVIGGPFGLSEDAKMGSDSVFSLSKMTFTHEMARAFLLEQIYRSISIIKNRNYHK